MNAKLKVWWEKQSARVDALSLRERVFLFVSVLTVGLAAGDALWLSPEQLAHKQVTQRFATQNSELVRLRAELAAAGQPVDASKAVREEIAVETAKLDALSQEIKAIAPLAEGGPALEQVLVQFLRRYEGLTLLGVGTVQQDAATAPVSAAPAAGVVGSAITKRGLELRVAGPYAELVRYVKALENALPSLRWGPMVLKSDKQQASELTLQVYVVGAQP
jgi:MSHA biogenesis protein MshJ